MKRAYVGERFDLNELFIKVFGYVAPPFPLIGDFGSQLSFVSRLKAGQGVADISDSDSQVPFDSLGDLNAQVVDMRKGLDGRVMHMPLTLTIPNSTSLIFPTEPMVSLKGSNRIIRRYPNRSESGGSIKERWSSDDYKITIKGIFIDTENDQYPSADIRVLRELCEYKGTLEVTENPLMGIFGIDHLVIKNYSIPFTPGLHAQAYQLSAWSDVLFDALLEET